METLGGASNLPLTIENTKFIYTYIISHQNLFSIILYCANNNKFRNII